MKIAFLYPGKPGDSLTEWVGLLARYCTDEIVCIPNAHQAGAFDMVFAITQLEAYPAIHDDLGFLSAMTDDDVAPPWAVIHNQDTPPVPKVRYDHNIAYPSFVWTRRAARLLADYKPILIRQPVLPRCVVPKPRPLHLGTFGSIEQKKYTFAMARTARLLDLPFTALVPEPLANRTDMGAREVRLWKAYIESVRQQGAEVVIHPWFDTVEELAPLLEEVSHLMFVLPPSKEGSGGSCTSPRCATAFARPVIVIDDEDTFTADRFFVYRDLKDITREKLEGMVMPSCDWSPDQYVKTLVKLTKEFWA